MTAVRFALLHLFLGAARRSPAGERLESGRSVLADPRVLSFARGLSLGALIGAAIAGSALWGGLRRRIDPRRER